MYAPIPMVPGPVTLAPAVREALARDYGSGQIEADFLALYYATGRALAQCMGTQNDVVIMTGEGMLALWAGLKSCLALGDKVLSIVTGIFGDGIGDMAVACGCNVRKVHYEYNETIHNLERIEEAIVAFRPHMIAAVHCETPSGTLNPLEGLGELKRRHSVPLLYVDAVASIGGTPVDADAHSIDLLLGGSQKCLSAPPNLAFLAVSETAWECAASVNYAGYESLLPWRTVQKDARCPYTPYWHGTAALYTAAHNLLNEGLENVCARHTTVAHYCHQGAKNLGLELWPAQNAVTSPTVSAFWVPEGWTWPAWQKALRRRGLVVAGSFGPMAHKVFRLGHMGEQARLPLMQQALAAMKDALHSGE